MKNSNKVLAAIIAVFAIAILASCDATWDDVMNLEVTEEQWHGEGGEGGGGHHH